MRNAVLDTTAQVAPLVMAQSFAQRGISVHLALAHPPSALLAIIKTRKEPMHKMSANFVRQDISVPVAQGRRGNVQQGRFRRIRPIVSKPSALIARRAWHAR